MSLSPTSTGPRLSVSTGSATARQLFAAAVWHDPGASPPQASRTAPPRLPSDEFAVDPDALGALLESKRRDTDAPRPASPEPARLPGCLARVRQRAEPLARRFRRQLRTLGAVLAANVVSGPIAYMLLPDDDSKGARMLVVAGGSTVGAAMASWCLTRLRDRDLPLPRGIARSLDLETALGRHALPSFVIGIVAGYRYANADTAPTGRELDLDFGWTSEGRRVQCAYAVFVDIDPATGQARATLPAMLLAEKGPLPRIAAALRSLGVAMRRSGAGDEIELLFNVRHQDAFRPPPELAGRWRSIR